MSESSENSPPNEFLDPISLSIMEAAVMISCGHSFSSASINRWLVENDKCPVCKQYVGREKPRANYALRSAIEKYTKKHGITLPEIELTNFSTEPVPQQITPQHTTITPQQITPQRTTISSAIGPETSKISAPTPELIIPQQFYLERRRFICIDIYDTEKSCFCWACENSCGVCRFADDYPNC
eukprot:TRINITY_DN1282_c0_g1_i1.p1 TRINITY_DN1282_c0_g1~~TRINITY_DN1282_c0_g1_i1.p1  ORF type:complete len:183 (+),score=15.21 TRINITY_DN1282_c0_g1_i1:127-675(+)